MERDVRVRVGLLSTLAVLLLFGSAAMMVDPIEVRRTAANSTAVPGFQSDEATYYLIGHSLASDGDLEYRREDLLRTLREFPMGPTGVFLKRGTVVEEIRASVAPPFVRIAGVPDPNPNRLYFGKSFIYPAAAAPFVKALGTRGFYVLNAVLVTVAFCCAFVFISSRSPVGPALLLASASIFASVVPVYYSWISPELFNCTLGIVAYFFWLYKHVSPPATTRAGRWLRGPASDVAAALVIGILTFSKPTNALLLGPIGIWWIWRREWRRFLASGLAWAALTSSLFAVNLTSSGDLNYQGGDRATCYGEPGRPFPFSDVGIGLASCQERVTATAQTAIWFDPQVFWQNLWANLTYFVVGRNSGVALYFFPLIFACVMFAGTKPRSLWQWLVLSSIIIQALVFIIITPYTYFGGGGSVGNRYFMGAYGMTVFLFPPVRSIVLALVPWLVGGFFMIPLVTSPFDTSIRPMDRGKRYPFRVFPVELTNLNDLPLNNERDLHVFVYGNDGSHRPFQLYRLDDDTYLREADALSFWTRADSDAEVLLKADDKVERIQFALYSEVPVIVRLTMGGATAQVSLEHRQRGIVQLAPGRGFLYNHARGSDQNGKDRAPAHVYNLAIKTVGGFTPSASGSHDSRHLGVRVLPLIVK